MPFRIPDTVFAPEHFGNGRKAPLCEIWVFFDCDPEFCEGGQMVAEIIDVDANTVIAGGPVTCDGSPKLHKYPMRVTGLPLMGIIVQTRFLCGSQANMRNGDTDRIWVQCP